MPCFNHPSGNPNDANKGARAVRLACATLRQHFVKSQVVETETQIDIKGSDLIVATPTGETFTVEVTSHQDPTMVSDHILGRDYARLTVAAVGNANIKNFFTCTAKYWMMSLPLHQKNLLYLLNVQQVREALRPKLRELWVSKKITTDKKMAVQQGMLYKRSRAPKYPDAADVIYYLPIAELESFATTLEVPQLAVSKEYWNDIEG